MELRVLSNKSKSLYHARGKTFDKQRVVDDIMNISSRDKLNVRLVCCLCIFLRMMRGIIYFLRMGIPATRVAVFNWMLFLSGVRVLIDLLHNVEHGQRRDGGPDSYIS